MSRLTYGSLAQDRNAGNSRLVVEGNTYYVSGCVYTFRPLPLVSVFSRKLC
jgi:hypothetical protein